VDQNTEILNQISAKSRELEILNATIMQILKEKPDTGSNVAVGNDAGLERDVSGYDTLLTAKPSSERDPKSSITQSRANEQDLRTTEPSGSGEISIPADDSGPTVTIPNRRLDSRTLPSTDESIVGPVQSERGDRPFIRDSFGIFRKPSAKYDRVRLSQEVWEVPMTTLALQYRVSASAVQKACSRLEVPTPPAGYWKRSASARQLVPRPELPKFNFVQGDYSRGYALEERAPILAQVAQEVSGGKNLAQACRNAGITYQTYRRWYSAHSEMVACEAQVGVSVRPETEQGSFESAKADAELWGVAPDSQSHSVPESDRSGANPSHRICIHRLSKVEGQTVLEMEMNAGAVPAKGLSDERFSGVRVSERLIRAHDREALYREVWSKSMSEVAKDYGVLTTTIWRRCKKLHIPTPPAGHWQRLASGFPSQQQPPLPLIEIVGKEQRQWRSNAYSFEEIINISKRISDGVSTGLSLYEACRKAGIPISTYRRWRKRSTRFGDAFGLVEFLPSNRVPIRRHGYVRTMEEKAAILGGIDDARRGGELLHVALGKAGISVNSYHRWRAQLANSSI